ncbi:MAG: TetR/AcrR family transcriptional regulator [Acidimicrobiales bacterium]|nr:TetR/AcrR family transcriptional regulator [Acidimicrobiales bacterium]
MTNRRPGRPRGAGVFDEEQLLDLALDALASGGYRSLSMRGVARELGVSLASVQHRHPTKDHLWRAAVDRILDGAAVSVIDGPFADVVRRRLATSADRPSLLFALLTDDAPGAAERLAYLADRLRPAVEEARSTFSDAHDAGIIRPIDIEVFVALMMVGVGALAAMPKAVTDVLGLGADPHGRLAEGFADIVLQGVVARADW